MPTTHRLRKRVAPPNTNCKHGRSCTCGFVGVFTANEEHARVAGEVHVEFPKLGSRECLEIAKQRVAEKEATS